MDMIAHSVYRCGGAVSFLQPLPQVSHMARSPALFVMKMGKLKTEQNRLEILRNCYRLMATGTWDAISVSMLEKNISQTRGAIFYFNKNKEDLFINMIDELFLPVFKLSQADKKTSSYLFYPDIFCNI